MSLKTSPLFFFDQAGFSNFKKPRKQPGKGDFEALTPPKGQQTVNIARSPRKTKKRLPASVVLTEHKAEDVVQAPERPGSGASVLNVFVSSLADEDEHVQYFENLKAAAPFLLTEIDGMILHCKVAGIPFPRGLENILNYSWTDLIKDVSYNRKQWPTAACKRICVPKKPPQKLSRTRGSATSASTITDSSRSRSRSAPISEELKEKTRVSVNQRRAPRSTVKEVKKTKEVDEQNESNKMSHSHGYTINFSVSSKACLDQGWIIKPYDETIAKLNWREIYTLMLEKLQVENTKMRKIVLQFNEQGGLMIDEDKTTLKSWQWPRRGKLPEPVWIKVNDCITIRIIGQFSIHFIFKWQYETIRFSLSPLPDVIPPRPDELFLRNRSSVQRTIGAPRAVPEITIYYLRQLHRKIKNIINDWMEYYRAETGLSKLPFVRRTESDRHIFKVQSKKEPSKSYMPPVKSFSPQADYVRFLSAPGQEQNACLPRSCSFSRNLAAMISREGNIGLMTANRHGSSTRANTQQWLRFPQVPKEEKEWLLSPSPCPVILRAAMMGTVKKRCHCSTTKIPNITDLEFDIFIKKSTAGSEQLIIVCIVSLQQFKSAPYEQMIQYLYEENNRNRNQPCVECQKDSFRLVKYDISTAHEYTGQSPALLVKRHNVTPGMFLMYIGGKLLFADHIFNGYSNSMKDLMKQITRTYDDYANGRHLLYDFRFSSVGSTMPSTTQDDTSLQRQVDQSARPKSETSFKPAICIFQSANRAVTIQDFIAFSLTQRNICCDAERIPAETMESMLECCFQRPN
ncbi:uncharacterized protein C3orf20-like isoform X2 [Stegostoma tigrinum]|uniref:uncharacterized protein C3orf20-like isoform X2 n=1 Tax=Stegostoma tigrinum TaxID=3053191 RepID=UPI00202B88D6|nr:uncharacterized protein C3orf20-like isoform X2 [Stegostoma tigrinum]